MLIEYPQIDSCCDPLQIQAYLDGEISNDEARLIENHLATCNGCLSLLNDEKRFTNSVNFALSSKPGFEPPARFIDETVMIASSSLDSTISFSEFRRAATILAFLAAILLLGTGYGSFGFLYGLESVFGVLSSIANVLLKLLIGLISLSFPLMSMPGDFDSASAIVFAAGGSTAVALGLMLFRRA